MFYFCGDCGENYVDESEVLCIDCEIKNNIDEEAYDAMEDRKYLEELSDDELNELDVSFKEK